MVSSGAPASDPKQEGRHDPRHASHGRDRAEAVRPAGDRVTLRRPTAAAAARTLDLDRPVALMLMGILGHIGDYDEARSIVERLLDALPSGSYLVLYDGTDTDEALAEAQQHYDEGGSLPYRLRSPGQIAGFFDGLELIDPGVVPTSRWRPAATSGGVPAEVKTYGGVGRKA